MNWKQAFALGLCSVGAYERKEPVAYFYPSVVLPELPEWDKSKYPYAVMWFVEHSSGEYTTAILITYNRPLVYTENFVLHNSAGDVSGTFTNCFSLPGGGSYDKYTCRVNSGTQFEYDLTSHITTEDGFPLFYTSTDSTYMSANRDAEWTNTDMVREDGTVYLPASTPVPAGNGMVAYKGMRLPKLPEWDKEKYPYITIIQMTEIHYGYRFTTHTPYYDPSKNQVTALICDKTTGGGSLAYVYNSLNDSTSNLNEEYFNAGETSYTYSLMILDINSMGELQMWSNANIYNKDDGSVYLAASDPVPVYA